MNIFRFNRLYGDTPPIEKKHLNRLVKNTKKEIYVQLDS